MTVVDAAAYFYLNPEVSGGGGVDRKVCVVIHAGLFDRGKKHIPSLGCD